jgi:hypothetical protein
MITHLSLSTPKAKLEEKMKQTDQGERGIPYESCAIHERKDKEGNKVASRSMSSTKTVAKSFEDKNDKRNEQKEKDPSYKVPKPKIKRLRIKKTKGPKCNGKDSTIRSRKRLQ